MDTIGTIRTPYKTKQDCPIQPLYTAGSSGRIEVLEHYADLLKEIETFSHIYFLYQFDRADAISLVRSTFLNDTRTVSMLQGIRADQTESGCQSSHS